MLLALVASSMGFAQTTPATPRLAFSEYLRRVGSSNLDAAAQRLNVPIAEAQIAMGRVFPDPQLTAGISQYDLTQAGNQTGLQVMVQVPMQIGGQRAARVEAAEAALSVTRAELEEFLRRLRGAAADAWIDGLHARLIRERKLQTMKSLERLVAVNQLRLKAGDIGEATLIQSRVEAEQFRAAVFDAEGSVKVADLRILLFLGEEGRPLFDEPLELDGRLEALADRDFSLATLLEQAKRQRPDALAARLRIKANESQLALTRANRIVDLNIGAGWQHYFPTSEPFALPAAELLTATVTVPLPFSRMYRGDVVAAETALAQSAVSSAALELQIETEVRQARARYNASAAQVRVYRTVLSEADKVLEKTLYNYQRGGATLVEVLVAQRTVDDVYLSYFEALVATAHALVAVELSAGFWDLDLK